MKFVREAVDAPHLFLAFDRSAKQSAMQHMFEAARGIRAGQADTCLLVYDMPAIFCELKAGKNKPSERQILMGKDVLDAGHHWFWCNSVTAYCDWLAAHGVPMRQHAGLYAEQRDATLAKDIATPARKRSAQGQGKPTASRLKKVNTLRGRVMF